MRSFFLSALAATAVLAATATGLSTSANAASRHHYRVHDDRAAVPYVGHSSFGSFNTYVPRGLVAPIAPVSPDLGQPREGPA